MYKCAYVMHVYCYTVCILSYMYHSNFVYFYVVISYMNMCHNKLISFFFFTFFIAFVCLAASIWPPDHRTVTTM